jgi:hypothetical protein
LTFPAKRGKLSASTKKGNDMPKETPRLEAAFKVIHMFAQDNLKVAVYRGLGCPYCNTSPDRDFDALSIDHDDQCPIVVLSGK